ncbi:tRNA glutamyl-Q(34) synthetase GluQRS [Alteromonas halophila]|uniref:Glutamyl-Q tRNA(Asp) synthetase n=1 Tax=Alteromonas halophila TaxID=516698 RepID=A0A918JM53_9ALTE|nr:tRNA glutamyl-Q(34) synthetase GluQRS [Alteromonas halophila]GGW83035.1 glutamyl-Q tRNA(Asp) synthetase [Alteromonas halophila]
MAESRRYTGRFAPSPSGHLHFGSLIAALASYLDAKASQGTWLVRMEDIDTPRCVPGMDTAILNALECHGLHWDGEVMYQSRQHARYQQTIEDLLTSGRAYYCRCTRKQVKAAGGVYPGTCRHLQLGPSNAALRVRLPVQVTAFDDEILGHQSLSSPAGSLPPLEDTIVHRRDGLYAYNLVVVMDDIAQQVTHIVRGSDLLPTTLTHLNMYALLDAPPPAYAHVPVASVAPGRKLSKQNHAAPLDTSVPADNLIRALRFLGQQVEDGWQGLSPETLLHHAADGWDRKKVAKQPEIIVDQHESTYYSGP